jgi:hypothetical protein
VEEYTVEIECKLVRTQSRAIAIIDGTTELMEGGFERAKWFWLPKSMIAIAPENAVVGQMITVTMPEEIAIEKGLI